MAERRRTALQSFIETFVGGNYVVTVTNVTVTTAPTRIVQNNFERMTFTVTNMGNVDIRFAPNNLVSANNGVVLGSAGGGVSLIANEDLAMVGWDWWGICATGSTIVTVFEVTRYGEIAT